MIEKLDAFYKDNDNEYVRRAFRLRPEAGLRRDEPWSSSLRSSGSLDLKR